MQSNLYSKKILSCLLTSVSRKEPLVIAVIERYLLNLQLQSEGKQNTRLHKKQDDEQHRVLKFFCISQYFGITWHIVCTTAWCWEIAYTQDPSLYLLFQLLSGFARSRKNLCTAEGNVLQTLK